MNANPRANLRLPILSPLISLASPSIQSIKILLYQKHSSICSPTKVNSNILLPSVSHRKLPSMETTNYKDKTQIGRIKLILSLNKATPFKKDNIYVKGCKLGTSTKRKSFAY